MKRSAYISALLLMALCGGCRKTTSTDDLMDIYAARMQRFVVDISTCARAEKPDFIIIPQNGAELAFNYTDPAAGINRAYIGAIDGIGVEALFYNGAPGVDAERLSMLRTLGSEVTVMVSDYVSSPAQMPDAVARSLDEGFIAFPRSADNYDYGLIPTDPTGENTRDIVALSDAANYLYLISTDGFSDLGQMLQAIAATNYDVVLIDPCFDGAALTSAQVEGLGVKANGGKRLVVAYLNIGAAEKWRSYWKPEWKKGDPKWLKKSYEGYSDEIWVEYWHEDWRRIIFSGSSSCVRQVLDAGFDGLYLDNVEGYYFLLN